MSRSVSLALLAVALAATTAHADRIRFAVDGVLVEPNAVINTPQGRTFTIDVVLDATAYADAFDAWHSYGFSIDAEGAFSAADISGNLDETNPFETAPTTGQAATGDSWTGGRRPGAFPSSSYFNGGTRFGNYLGNVVTDDGITGSTATRIGGRQATSGNPELNPILNTRRAFEAFRFQYTYNGDGEAVTLTIVDPVINIYPNPGSAFNLFIDPDPEFIGSVTFVIPAPASLALLAVGVAGTRRRR